ncbi:MAG TPA: hypothetical protein VK851_05055 [Anaerolineales bacterium]|nr:hypothetical protein [Anaerolineales bacterium]
MSNEYRIGEKVQVYLNENWFEGTIVRIEPYSEHRSFHWVELDDTAQAVLGMKQISVFNPKNIRKA